MSFCNKTASEYVEAALKHKDVDNKFIKESLCLLRTNSYEITTGCSDLGKLIKKRGNAVIRESYKLSAYVRLKPFAEMILLGNCFPEHNTGDMIAKYVSHRFQKFLILIFTNKDYHIATERAEITNLPDFSGKSTDDIIKNVRAFVSECHTERLSDDYLAMNTDDLWEVFYETQYLSQRKNLKLYHKDIPKYMFEKANMKIEKDFYDKTNNKHRKNKTLDKFVGTKE